MICGRRVRLALLANRTRGEVVSASPGMVRAEGLEPPQLSSLEPKSSASTNSATPANSIMFGRDAASGGLITWAHRFAAKKWPFRSLPAVTAATGHIRQKMVRIGHGRSDFP